MCTTGARMISIETKELTITRGGKTIIRDLSVDFEGPGLYQIIGPNGSGKTTLLLTLMGVIKPIRGSIDVKLDIEHRGPVFSYMPQDYVFPPDAPISVYEFVRMHLEMSRPWPRLWKTQDLNSRVIEILESLRIPKILWHEKLSNLSGGMTQRVLLARTLVVDAPILLLDEPLSNIDPDGRVEIAELIAEHAKEKLVLATSHDPVLLLDNTKKILLLGSGTYVFGDVDEIMKYDILAKFYKKCAIEIGKHIHIADWH